MVFPATILDLRVELLLGSLGWTDVTSYVKQDGGVVITRGHADESTVTNPSTLTLPLKNADGRFSSRNPTGPYYGNLVRNTQVRVSVPEGASYLRCEVDQFSYASMQDTAGISVTGDTEIQIDVTLDNWRANQVLAKKWNTGGNQRSWILMLNEDGTLTFAWSNDGTAINSRTSTQPVPDPALRRQAIKITLQVNFSTTTIVTFFTAPAALNQAPLGPITTGFTQVGAGVQTGGSTSVFDSTADMLVAAPGSAVTSDFPSYSGIYGKVHSFKLLSGIGGTVKASPDFTVQTAGATSFNDAQSNFWFLSGNSEISNRKYRVHAEVVSWPQTWDPSGTDVTVQVIANGMLRRAAQGTRRRLGTGGSPLLSAIRRYWLRVTGALAPVAYWPCEDLRGRQISSGLPDGAALDITGKPTLAGDSSFACSAPLPVITTGTFISGPVPAYPPGDLSVTCLLTIPPGGDASGGVLLSVYMTGTQKRLDLGPNGGTTLAWGAYDATNTVTTIGSSNSIPAGPVAVRLELTTSGGNVNWKAEYMSPGGTPVTFETAGTGSYAGTVGRAQRVVINNTDPFGVSLNGTAVGHVAIQSAASGLSDLQNALNAYAGETAGNRFVRLCAEEGYLTRTRGRLATTVPMGPQSIATLMALLQECADADRGQIYEPREALTLGYRTRGSLQNQAAAVALSYTAFHLAGSLTPADDDQQIQNDVTVTRTGGSSFRKQLFSGALSIQSPPAGVGPYPASATLNFQSDSYARQEAGWLLHMGTVDENRFPLIQHILSRAAVAGLFYDLQDAGLGDRVTVSNTPVWLSPNGIDQIISQTTERMGGFVYETDWAGVPATPYATGVIGSTFRLDTDGSTFHSSATSGATSLSIDSAGALWTTAAGDFPFDIKTGGPAGERITVTNITGAASPQTFTVTRSVNGVVKAHSAGEAISLFAPSYVTLS